MSLPDQLQNLLDYARAEAKRADHGHVEPAHLVAALPRLGSMKGVSIDPALEAKARARLSSLAAASSAEQEDAPQTTALLDRISGEGDMWGALLRELEEALGDVSPEPQSASERSTEASAATADPPPAPSSLPYALAAVGEVVQPDLDLIGRDEEVAEIIGLLARRTPKSPCVVGVSGSGRTSLMNGIAAYLASESALGTHLAGHQVVRIRAESVVALRRALTLREAIDSAPPETILALDDIEVLSALGSAYADLDMLGVIQAAVGDPSKLVILTISEAQMGRLAMHNPDLANDVVQLPLRPLKDVALHKVSDAVARSLAEFHGVEITQSAADMAASPAAVEAGRIHPGLLVDRLDAACSKARLKGQERIDAADIEISGGEAPRMAVERRSLEEKLLGVVHGQDEAVSRVCARVALTKAKLDLRPERPDGVFLFVGPTGVGKTALARALAHELFGHEEAMIRLDMSEYAHDWALSRLVGPQPGYVGYTEPEGWLTTKIRNQPHAVVILDEVEKAHPTIWNAFLQVFDAGRLTDARGTVASFSDAVIVMTSNLGSRSFKAPQLGFGNASADTGASERVMETVRSDLPPEFFNRIDETVIFQPLSREVIAGITESEIERVLARMEPQGYQLRVPPDVVELVATTGFDPSMGARHLQRNIERYLLETLIDHGPGQWTAQSTDGNVIWRQGNHS